MFEKYGPLVRVTVPMDRTGSRNKGFAFVEFEERKDAEDAFDKYDGYKLDGRSMRLDWDVGREKKEGSRGGYGGGPEGGAGGCEFRTFRLSGDVP
ncbi:hypothetical protein DFJ74DRAFT_679428 [Hyaloraphidium curvatum]|nr:hypothetical protein DFJ74DRAFT_679428 [Hyaloraphidium curvatum]